MEWICCGRYFRCRNKYKLLKQAWNFRSFCPLNNISFQYTSDKQFTRLGVNYWDNIRTIFAVAIYVLIAKWWIVLDVIQYHPLYSTQVFVIQKKCIDFYNHTIRVSVPNILTSFFLGNCKAGPKTKSHYWLGISPVARYPYLTTDDKKDTNSIIHIL